MYYSWNIRRPWLFTCLKVFFHSLDKSGAIWVSPMLANKQGIKEKGIACSILSFKFQSRKERGIFVLVLMTSSGLCVCPSQHVSVILWLSIVCLFHVGSKMLEMLNLTVTSPLSLRVVSGYILTQWRSYNQMENHGGIMENTYFYFALSSNNESIYFLLLQFFFAESKRWFLPSSEVRLPSLVKNLV